MPEAIGAISPTVAFRILLVGAALFAAAVMFAQSSSASNLPVQNETGTISSDTTWPSGFVYVVNSLLIDNNVTLTLQPGVIVKMASGYSGRIRFNTGAQLVAHGTAGQPIVFTSLKDDSFGGDSNGDGSATSPAAGDWSAIAVASGSSASGGAITFDHVTVRYGGYCTDAMITNLHTLSSCVPDATNTTATIAISNSTIDHSSSNGIELSLGSSLSVTNSTVSNNASDGIVTSLFPGASSTITNDTFQGNSSQAVYIGSGLMSAASSISGNTGSGNGENAIEIDHNTVSGNLTLGANPSLPYLFDTMVLGDSSTLTLQPGAIVKMAPGYDGRIRINTSALLVAQGTAAQPIVFTSLADDTYGGDTNGDGSATSPAPGDWSAIAVAWGSSASSGGLSFDHAIVRYGGYCTDAMITNLHTDPSCDPDATNTTATIVIDDSTIERSSSNGVELSLGSALSVTDSAINNNAGDGISTSLFPGAALTITDNTLQGNAQPAVYVGSGLLSGAGVTISGNTGSGNAENSIEIDHNTVSGSVTLGANATLPYHLDTMVLGGNSTLTMQAGAIAKMSAGYAGRIQLNTGASLVAQGAAGQPVVFTSLADDTYGGDTNANGSATSAAPGDWSAIAWGSSASGGSLNFDHAIVRFGGYCTDAMITNLNTDISCAPDTTNTTAAMTITNSIIERSSSTGLAENGGASLNISTSSINHNAFGVMAGISSAFASAQHNWWGASSGPSSNGQACATATGTGQKVSCYVTFSSWLTCDSVSGACSPNCSSSVNQWPVTAGDDDCDGFSTTLENFMGTLPSTKCASTTTKDDEPTAGANIGPDAWPVDFNDDEKSDISDILKYYPVFNTTLGGPTGSGGGSYNKRYDLNGDNKINISDILTFAPFFNKTCS